MEKINILELLKDCPKGMELDCTMWDNVCFVGVAGSAYPIKIETPEGLVQLDKYGCYSTDKYAKCVIFPKGKTTWEGFQRPFEDGVIVATHSGPQVFILQKTKKDNVGYCYIGYDFEYKEFFAAGEFAFDRLATEEEIAKLFQVIKDNAYKWNAKTKTLEKLVEHKFKVGDRVKHISAFVSGTVVKVTSKGYHIDYPTGEGVCYVNFALEKDYELVPNKFDITTLKPFDKVLVRDGAGLWRPSLFGNDMIVGYRYFTSNGSYKECIPYEGNEHLLGKTDDCDEFYKTWR